MERYDLCVIGAGTAGFAAAERGRALGRSVVVISGPGDLGGTCILRGCMPAKTLLSATERLGDVDAASEVGVEAQPATIDLRRIVARKRELVDYFAEDRVHDLQTYPLRRGSARFLDAGTIDVDGDRVGADRFIIASGSHIVAPAIPGLAASNPFTSDDALDMTELPSSIAVVGGGPVGCEFAQYFARLGSRVTLIQSEPHLLRKEDPDVGDAIAAFLAHDGVDVRRATQVRNVRIDAPERVLALDDGSEVRVARIMLASGRVPRTAALDLKRAGVACDERGAVIVDAMLCTSNPAIFAAGDVLGRRCLVHVAERAGTRAVENAFSAAAPQAMDFDRFEAHAVYTQPNVAVAGLTERDARERKLAFTVRRHPFADIGKAVVAGTPEGFVKMLAAPDGRILGVAIVGEDAIDLIGEAIALIDRGATTAEVAAMPHLHPTMSEILARVADDFSAVAAG